MQQTHPALYWYLRGARNLISVPAFILMSAFVGFAGFAKESGIELGHAVLMTALVWALPAKVVLIASASAGIGLFATAFAVALSSVRMMPMVSALVPELRGPNTRTSTLLFLAHFVAVTAWVIAMEKVREVPRAYRTVWFAGVGLTLTVVNAVIVGVVYQFAAGLPAAALGALFFLTPIYFLTSLWATARDHVVKIAMVFGLILGPICHVLVPEIDLLVAGLIGGVLAFFAGKHRTFGSST